MQMNNYDLLVGGDILVVEPIVNLATGANVSTFASLKNVDKLYFLVLMAAGTADEPAVITLQQAKDAAATGVKALNITDLHYKSGADLSAINAWTKVDAITRHDSVASWSGGSVGAATDQQAVVIRVHEDDLDVNNGFTHVRLNIADTGVGARNGCVLAIAPAMGYQGVSKPSLAT